MMWTAALLAVSITATPIADEDFLEPSVLNEVEHAIDVAPTNTVKITAASVEFAALYATNGLSTTARAIQLVSSQKDGRWLFNGEEVTPIAVRILSLAAGLPPPPLAIPPEYLTPTNMPAQTTRAIQSLLR